MTDRSKDQRVSEGFAIIKWMVISITQLYCVILCCLHILVLQHLPFWHPPNFTQCSMQMNYLPIDDQDGATFGWSFQVAEKWKHIVLNIGWNFGWVGMGHLGVQHVHRKEKRQFSRSGCPNMTICGFLSSPGPSLEPHIAEMTIQFRQSGWPKWVSPQGLEPAP